MKILSGKDRGKHAKVIRVFPDEQRVLLEGMNMKKKHRRSRRQDKKGEVVLVPSPLAASAVALVCNSCGKATRVGYRFDTPEKKVRICKQCGKET